MHFPTLCPRSIYPENFLDSFLLTEKIESPLTKVQLLKDQRRSRREGLYMSFSGLPRMASNFGTFRRQIRTTKNLSLGMHVSRGSYILSIKNNFCIFFKRSISIRFALCMDVGPTQLPLKFIIWFGLFREFDVFSIHSILVSAFYGCHA